MSAEGEVAPVSQRIERADLVRYAGASGDFNPIHWNEEFARGVGLPGVIAHGMYSMAVAARMVSAHAGGPGGLRRLKVRFSGMLQPGQTLTAQGEATAGADGRVVLSFWGTDEQGNRVLSKGEAELDPR